jgi:hypothetical protein
VDFRPTLRERRRCTTLPVPPSATMQSILAYICPWRQNKRMIWCSSLHSLAAGCWRKEEIACKDACWRRGYVNSAFVTHTQFRPAPQWPNILQSGFHATKFQLRFEDVFTWLRNIARTLEQCTFKPSRKINLYIISQTSFWREAFELLDEKQISTWLQK